METHFLLEVFDQVCQAQVNSEAGREIENTVAVVNGLTGKVEQRRPPSRRFRFRREGIREGLLEGVDVQVGPFRCGCSASRGLLLTSLSGISSSSACSRRRMEYEPSFLMAQRLQGISSLVPMVPCRPLERF